MPPRDTSVDALHVQTAALTRLSGSERICISIELSEATRELARAGVRARHPEYDANEIELALFRLLYGDELFRAVWPDESLRPA
jgi:hypothetical protein